jgi:hypothetical protein
LLAENQSKICYASLDALFENHKGPGNDSETALFGGKVFFLGPPDPAALSRFNPAAFILAQKRTALNPRPLSFMTPVSRSHILMVASTPARQR